MILHTHFHIDDLELVEMTKRRAFELPLVDPRILPEDAEMVLRVFPLYYGADELVVVWLGDFGMYRCKMVDGFHEVVVEAYFHTLRRLDAGGQVNLTLQ